MQFSTIVLIMTSKGLILISFLKVKIDSTHDTLHDVIYKKGKNNHLSSKSFREIENILNTQYNMQNGAAKYILGLQSTSGLQSNCGEFNSSSIRCFLNDIQNINKEKIKSEFMCNTVTSWQKTAQFMIGQSAAGTLLRQSVKINSMPQIASGEKADIYIDNGKKYVIKTFKSDDVQTAYHEVNMYNRYNSQSHLPAIFMGQRIKMPYIKGTITTDKNELYTAVSKLYKKGFMIWNAKPSNFLKKENGSVVPVDFSLIFPVKQSLSLPPDTQLKIVNNYLDEGFRWVPHELKEEYRYYIARMCNALGEKNPLRSLPKQGKKDSAPL